jgi:formamidopyrimidine-DNA glycosylase
MPELPEVETVRRGIEPWILNREITGIEIRVAKLRQPLQTELGKLLIGQTVRTVERRGKYLLLRCSGGSLILHLGMSGYLRVLKKPASAGRHDHADICFSGGICLRLAISQVQHHVVDRRDPLFIPCSPTSVWTSVEAMSGEYLRRSRKRRLAVKPSSWITGSW